MALLCGPRALFIYILISFSVNVVTVWKSTFTFYICILLYFWYLEALGDEKVVSGLAAYKHMYSGLGILN